MTLKFMFFSKPGISILKLYEQDINRKFLKNKYDIFMKKVGPITKKIPQTTVKKLFILKDDLKIPAVLWLLHKDWRHFVLKNTAFILKA